MCDVEAVVVVLAEAEDYGDAEFPCCRADLVHFFRVVRERILNVFGCQRWVQRSCPAIVSSMIPFEACGLHVSGSTRTVRKHGNSPDPRWIALDLYFKESNKLLPIAGRFFNQTTCLVYCALKIEPNRFVLGYSYFDCFGHRTRR